MRRFPFCTAVAALAALALVVPAAASAQVHLLLEGGLSFPAGSFAKVAGSGYNGRIGIEGSVPHFPLSLRAEGEADGFTSVTSVGHVTVVSGSASVIFSLGRVGGLKPYVLAGIGEYSTSISGSAFSSSLGVGYHAGVGLNFGGTGITGFVELRLVNVNGDNYQTRYFPLTAGLRL